VSDQISTLVLVTILAAYIFDFLNGFHDAANSIATVVSTRVLSPRQAVMWAAFFNFIAAFVFSTAVAKAIETGIVKPGVLDTHAVLAAMIGAIFWNIFTWYYGLPSSSSHALMGGLVGAAIAKSGFGAVEWPGKIMPALLSMVVSPTFGLILGFIFMLIVFWLFQRSTPSRVDRLFRRLQLVSAALYSLGHGGNDAQKTMGVIMALLVAIGVYKPKTEIPAWIILSCHAAIALGTLFGGWRIVHTMGSKITKLKPVGGFCAETAGAVTIIANSYIGLPVSTTHVITGAIMGVGATRRLSAVKWGVTGRIVMAWFFTIPGSAGVAGGSFYVIRALF
jgi:inorganic phosphate transporter, PiT family